jgi:simple sugar transport system ATP-binding protein
VARLFSIIRGLKERGVAVLFVSHKLDEVLAISERITVLRSGEAVADGEAAAFDRNSLARHMTGRDVVAPSPPRPRGDAPALLAVTGASRAGSFQDVTFQVGAGEIVGLAGLRGSGRTDLALAIFGLRPLERGSVAVGGIRLALRSPAEAIAAGIAYVPEDRIVEGLFLEQPIGRNVMATILRSLAGRFGLLDRRRARTAVDRWLERLGVACASTEAPVQTLSGGNQQKVVLAKWLAAQARLLIVNGPTVGVDVGAKAEIHALLADIASKGAGMLVLSDDLPELVATAHRILIMHRGRLVDELRGAAEPDLRARLEALR